MFNNKGQTLIELVVVVAVIVMVVGALVFATIASLRNSSFAKNQAQATKLAQEGLERVRTGRDRNECIKNLSSSVNSWNGNSTDTNCPGLGSIWDYSINQQCGSSQASPPLYCYLNVNAQGVLTYLIASSDVPTSAESIADANGNFIFQRVVVLSDRQPSYDSEKTVTVIVRWIDFSGKHDSKLTTLLRKI